VIWHENMSPDISNKYSSAMLDAMFYKYVAYIIFGNLLILLIEIYNENRRERLSI